MKPTLVVMAAGMGSRYGGLKQMEAVGPSGETIIDYSIFDAARAGFGRAVFILRREFADDFRAKLGSRFEKALPVDYVYQDLKRVPGNFKVPESRKKPWGTGHAILSAADAVEGPFAVLNADDFYGLDAFKVMAERLKRAQDSERADYSMVGYVLNNTLSENGTVTRGVCERDPEGRLIKVTERKKIERSGKGAVDHAPEGDVALTGKELVSMNFWGFTPSIFGHLERLFAEFLNQHGSDDKAEFFIPVVVDSLIRHRVADVDVLPCDGRWFGVTYPEDKAVVKAAIADLVKAKAYPEKLFGAS